VDISVLFATLENCEFTLDMLGFMMLSSFALALLFGGGPYLCDSNCSDPFLVSELFVFLNSHFFNLFQCIPISFSGLSCGGFVD
jgi:hypothetical protein